MRQSSAAAHSDAPEVTRKIQKANVPPLRRARTRVGLPQQTWEAKMLVFKRQERDGFFRNSNC